jgi:hypothetical protein
MIPKYRDYFEAYELATGRVATANWPCRCELVTEHGVHAVDAGGNGRLFDRLVWGFRPVTSDERRDTSDAIRATSDAIRATRNAS